MAMALLESDHMAHRFHSFLDFPCHMESLGPFRLPEPATLPVVILAGQAPAVGYAPSQSQQTLESTFVHSSSGKEGPLGVGFGAEDDLFGPELGFGWEWSRHHDHYKKDLVIAKAAFPGSMSVDWRPPSSLGETGPHYNALLDVVGETLELIERAAALNTTSNEVNVELAALMWVSGYEDALQAHHRADYAMHLTRWIQDVRVDLKRPDLPVVIAALGVDMKESTVEREMNEYHAAVANQVGNCRVSTTSIEPESYIKEAQDRFHYGGRADVMMELGRNLAKTVLEMYDAPKQAVIAQSQRSLQSAKQYGIVMTFLLQPSKSLPNVDCDAFIEQIILQSFNQEATCSDTSCFKIETVQVDGQPLSYAAQSGQTMLIASEQISANVRILVQGGCTGCTLPSTLLGSDSVTAQTFVDNVNLNLLTSDNTVCAESIGSVSSAVNLLPETDTCPSTTGSFVENFQLTFRLKDTTGTISTEVQEDYKKNFTALAGATYNELNLLSPILCDNFHRQAVAPTSARVLKEHHMRDRDLSGKSPKAVDSLFEGVQSGVETKSVKSASSYDASRSPNDHRSIKSSPSTKSSKGPASRLHSKSSSTKSPKSNNSRVNSKSTKSPSSSSSTKSVKSLKSRPTSSPEAAPSLIPGAATVPSQLDATCVGDGCGTQQELFADVPVTSSRRFQQRHLTAVEELEGDCLCPENPTFFRAPTQVEFQAKFEETFLLLQSAGQYSELACVRPSFSFDATVAVNLMVPENTEPTEEDLMRLGREYITQYNQLNAVESCDRFSRSLTDSFSVRTVERVDLVSSSRLLRGRNLAFSGFSLFTSYYTYTGSCTNCFTGLGLYGDDITGRRELQGIPTLLPSDKCLCLDPDLPLLTEERFIEETSPVFEALFDELESIEGGEIVTDLSPFVCPTGFKANLEKNWFEIEGRFLNLQVMDVAILLTEENTCTTPLQVGPASYFEIGQTPTGPFPSDALTADTRIVLDSNNDMVQEGGRIGIVSRIDTSTVGQGQPSKLGFLLDSPTCGVLGPNQLTLDESQVQIRCFPIGFSNIPPLTETTGAPTKAPTTASPTTKAPTTQAPTPVSVTASAFFLGRNGG